ncbi:hypothetical protein [Metabacillus sp. 84]|uniref:hypothetical protein n=1 Tax=Metabacillus sp. 84 TaxID=3404705 RepID=UPI003CED5A28
MKGGVKVSFTIKCDKCGGEQVFTNKSKRWGDHIEINVDTYKGYFGTVDKSIDIYCENIDCQNKIEIRI